MTKNNSLFANKAATATMILGATFGFAGNALAQSNLAHSNTASSNSADFRQKVERSIDKNLNPTTIRHNDKRGVATVAVNIAADGSVRSAHLVRTTGVARFDKEALRTAQAVSYPATGKDRTVAMVLGFNQPVTAASQQEGQRLVLAWRSDQRVMLADSRLSAAHQPDS